MTRVAFVFPGQGSQSVGMGQALAAASPAAAAVFAEADDVLGEPISRLCWEGPAETLDLTVNAQPALLATTIAYLAALRERWSRAEIEAPEPTYAAGHSMGQYSALVAAGSLALSDGVRLVRERGQQMQRSGAGAEGRMAAIIGLDDGRLPELLVAARLHGTFGIANRNSPGQVVVSGDRLAVEASMSIAKELGARRAIERPVSVAAHSPLMAAAAAGMKAVLADIAFADPHPPLLANADGRVLETGDECRAELVDHLTTGVDWITTVERMVADRVDTFVEIGPGRVLSGLIKRIAPDVDLLATDDPAAADRLAFPFATAGRGAHLASPIS